MLGLMVAGKGSSFWAEPRFRTLIYLIDRLTRRQQLDWERGGYLETLSVHSELVMRRWVDMRCLGNVVQRGWWEFGIVVLIVVGYIISRGSSQREIYISSSTNDFSSQI